MFGRILKGDLLGLFLLSDSFLSTKGFLLGFSSRVLWACFL